MESLNTFATWTIVMLAISLLLGSFLVVLNRRRDLWLRYVNSEMSLWLRWGMSPRLLNPVRRFYESRWFVYIIRTSFFICLILTLLHAGAYLYYKDKLKKRFRPSPVMHSHISLN